MRNQSNTPQAIVDVSGSVADWATRMLPSKFWFAGFFFEQFLPETCSPTKAGPDLECPSVKNGDEPCPSIAAASKAGTAQPSDDADTCPVDLIVALLLDNNRACREHFEEQAKEPLPLQRKPDLGKCCLLSLFFNTSDEYRKVHDIALADSTTPTLEPMRESDQLAPGSREDPGRQGARRFPGCGHYLDTRALRRLLQTVRKLDKKRKQKKPIAPIDLEQLRKQACKVLAGGAGHPDSDDDSSSSSTSSRSSSSEDDAEEACYKNGVADVFGEKSMVKVPLLKSKGYNLRYTPAGNTPNMLWQDGKKLVERLKKRNKSGTTTVDPEKYTGWDIKYNQNKKQVHKFIGLKKYLPRHPDKKPEKAEMERREAMMKSMGDAKIARGLLMGFASERVRFKLANKIVGVSYSKVAQKSGTITRRYLGRIYTGKRRPSAKNKRGYTPIEQSCTGTIRLLGLRRAFQKCKTWRKKKERARDAKKVIKKHRIREKLWSRRNDIELGKMLDLRYAARAILLRERYAKGTGSNAPQESY
eukprot:g10897.t1